jgi:hypothetical protein
MPIPRIIPFVEGQGDVSSIPILIRRVLQDKMPETLEASPIHISRPWRVGHVHKISGNNSNGWTRYLTAAATQGASAVLLVLDGDNLPGGCPVQVAQSLAEVAKLCGAGKTFSVAVVFAMQEIESWFIADSPALLVRQARKKTGRLADIVIPNDLEKSPRDAKRWLSERMTDGYIPTIHQAEFARSVNLNAIRAHSMRSFRRFEGAIEELFKAVHAGSHVVSPS